MNNFWNNLKQKIVNKYPQLGWFIRYKQEIDEEDDKRDYVLGQDNGIIRKDLVPDGDWLKVLSEINKKSNFFEAQKGRFFDTISCTAFGTLNGVELIEYIKWLMIVNYSDKFTAKLSGNTVRGNLVSNVTNSIRKYHGLVNEKDWSWNRDKDRWKDFYTLVPSDILDKGKIWLKKYKFNYERLGADHNSIREGLKKSPVGVGLYAWWRKGDKYYFTSKFNHWAIIIKQDWGKSYTILDSYKPFIKTLDWNYKFGFPRIFYLSKTNATYNQEQIDILMERGLKWIMDVEGAGEIYELTKKGLVYINADQARDLGLRTLEKSKQFVGVSKEMINKIIL